jgi:hypothetical protein
MAEIKLGRAESRVIPRMIGLRARRVAKSVAK